MKYDLLLLPAMLAAPLIAIMLKPWVKAGGKINPGRFVVAVGISIIPLCTYWALEPIAKGYVNHENRCAWTQENWAMYNKRFQYGCRLAGYAVALPPKILPDDYRACADREKRYYKLDTKQAREFFDRQVHHCAFNRAQVRESVGGGE